VAGAEAGGDKARIIGDALCRPFMLGPPTILACRDSVDGCPRTDGARAHFCHAWHSSGMRSLIAINEAHGAQRVLNYLGCVGSAGLTTLDGTLLLCTTEDGRPLDTVARRIASAVDSPTEPLARVECLTSPGTCTFYIRVGPELVLFVVAKEGMAPLAVTEQLTRAARVFDRVLRTASRGGPPPGSPDGALDAVPVGETHQRRW
jgi:hypothetical protein